MQDPFWDSAESPATTSAQIGPFLYSNIDQPSINKDPSKYFDFYGNIMLQCLKWSKHFVHMCSISASSDTVWEYLNALLGGNCEISHYWDVCWWWWYSSNHLIKNMEEATLTMRQKECLICIHNWTTQLSFFYSSRRCL